MSCAVYKISATTNRDTDHYFHRAEALFKRRLYRERTEEEAEIVFK